MLIIGNRLKQIRKRLGKTQQEIADRLGISLRTYQAWEQDDISEMMSIHFNLFRWLNRGNEPDKPDDSNSGQNG